MEPTAIEKKPNKFKRIIKAFNPTTRKGGMMLSALIFALIFAGVGTWKLFFSKAAPVIAGNILIYNRSEFTQTNQGYGVQKVYGNNSFYRTNIRSTLIPPYGNGQNIYDKTSKYSISGKYIAISCNMWQSSVITEVGICIFDANHSFVKKINVPLDKSKYPYISDISWVKNDESLVFSAIENAYKIDFSGKNFVKLNPNGLPVYGITSDNSFNKIVYSSIDICSNGGCYAAKTYIANSDFTNPVELRADNNSISYGTYRFSNNGSKVAASSNWNGTVPKIFTFDNKGAFIKTLARMGTNSIIGNIVWSNNDQHILFERTICDWSVWEQNYDKPDYELSGYCPSSNIFALDANTTSSSSYYPFIENAYLIDIQPLAKRTKIVSNDFNGDGKSDIGVYSAGRLITNVIIPMPYKPLDHTNKWAQGDYDGNGIVDWAYVNKSMSVTKLNGVPDQYPVGISNGNVLPGDYDGDKIDDIAGFYTDSTSAYFQLKFANKPWTTIKFGKNTDIPVVGDYDGNGTTDIAVYRPKIANVSGTGKWYIRGQTEFSYGNNPTDIPVPADYNGDGKTDAAVYRPSTGDGTGGKWFVRGTPDYTTIGKPGDVPVPGDYDGNGTTDIAVFRPSNNRWYILGKTSIALGQPGDKPVNLPSAIYFRFFK